VASFVHVTNYFSGVNIVFANVKERSRSLIILLAPVRISSLCRLSSVTLVHPTVPTPTQAVEIFGNFYTALGTFNWPPFDIRGKFYGEHPREPLRLGVKHKRVAILDLSKAVQGGPKIWHNYFVRLNFTKH